MSEIVTNNKHHSFAPSSLERIENCPPSWEICKNMLRDDSGKDASRGDLMHRAFYDDSALAELNGKDKEVILALRKEHIEPYPAEKGIKHFHELFVEIKDETGETLTTGTLDYLIISADEKIGSLIDLKFGSYEVTPAGDNPQIWAYAIGVFQKFPKLEQLFALIAQPVFGIGNFDQQAVFKRSDLPRLIARIKQIEDNAEKADSANFAEYHPSTSDCRYCNKMQCPVHRNWMIENMRVMGLTEHDLPKDVVDMTVEYADRVKLAEKAIKDQMTPLSNMATLAIKNFGGSEHWKVCNGRVTKTVDWKSLCTKYNISDDEIAEFTTEKTGEPYVTARTRKSTPKKEIA